MTSDFLYDTIVIDPVDLAENCPGLELVDDRVYGTFGALVRALESVSALDKYRIRYNYRTGQHYIQVG